MTDPDRCLLCCPIRRDLYVDIGAYAYARGITVSETMRRALARLIEADPSADASELATAAQLGDMGIRPYTPRTASQLARAAFAARAEAAAQPSPHPSPLDTIETSVSI